MALFGKSKVVEHALELSRELERRFSPAMEKEGDRKISAKGISNILEEIYLKAVDFKQKEKLGFIRTARLGNTFRWELKELGYSDEFIKVATEGLIVYLTRKTVPNKPTESGKK